MDFFNLAIDALVKAYSQRPTEAQRQARAVQLLDNGEATTTAKAIARAILDTINPNPSEETGSIPHEGGHKHIKNIYLISFASICYSQSAWSFARTKNTAAKRDSIARCLNLYKCILNLHGFIATETINTMADEAASAIASGIENALIWNNSLLKCATRSSPHLCIVLGMHRSGTSCLANFLHELGCSHLGNLLPANDGNERGYHESTDIYKANQNFLRTIESEYEWRLARPLILDDSLLHSSLQEWRLTIARVLSNGLGEKPVVVKDPRFCILLPYINEWTQLRKCEWHCFISVRHPFGSAISLNRRNKATIVEGLKIWIAYNLSAEKSSRHIRRIFVLYPEIVRDSQEWSDLICSFLANGGVAVKLLSTEARECLDPSLIHNTQSLDVAITSGLETGNPALEQLAVDLYMALRDAALSGHPPCVQKMTEVESRYFSIA